MPGHIRDALIKFKHLPPSRKQDAPYPYTAPKYRAKTQYAKAPDNSPLLGKDKVKFIQRIVGKFTFIARACHGIIQPALSALATEQAAPSENTMKKTKQILDYVASQEDPVLTFLASDMVLAGHSNASYLSKKMHKAAQGVIGSFQTIPSTPPTMALS